MTPRNTDISKLLYGVVDIFRKREKVFPISEIDKAWEDCERRIKRAAYRNAMRRRITVWSGAAAAAAVVILMLWPDGGGHADAPGLTAIQDITTYALNTEVPMTSGHIINMVPGCDTTEVDQNRASISCLANGRVLVNGRSVSGAAVNPSADRYCQLAVPKGRRAEIVFADGTHIWVNSDSRVVYPQEFSGDTREIYVSGEVYLDVAPDKKHPFIVRNKDFNVTVLGTSFNIMAYGNGAPSQVVLVSGKVDVDNSSDGTVTMSPGQLVDVTGSAISSPRRVDVTPYVSWKDNLLVYSDKSIADVFSRLNICYGREFVLSSDVTDIKVTGKLYLKDDIEDVLHAIAFSAPVRYEERGDSIYVFRTGCEGTAP